MERRIFYCRTLVMALAPKALVLPGPTDQGRSRDGRVPSARGEGQDIQGYLSPALDLCMTQQLPSLCCAHSPHLPVPTSTCAGAAEEQCMSLPETGAPGTAPGPDPCTPAGRSPVVRAGSARGTRLGCSCKHSPASGRPRPWDHLSCRSELGSPVPAPRGC